MVGVVGVVEVVGVVRVVRVGWFRCVMGLRVSRVFGLTKNNNNKKNKNYVSIANRLTYGVSR